MLNQRDFIIKVDEDDDDTDNDNIVVMLVPMMMMMMGLTSDRKATALLRRLSVSPYTSRASRECVWDYKQLPNHNERVFGTLIIVLVLFVNLLLPCHVM